MSDLMQDHRRDSWVRRASGWIANKPETTAWIAVATAVMVLMEVGDHLLGWW